MAFIEISTIVTIGCPDFAGVTQNARLTTIRTAESSVLVYGSGLVVYTCQ